MRSVSDRVQLIRFVLYTAINARSSIMCLSERREGQLAGKTDYCHSKLQASEKCGVDVGRQSPA